ncbi:MAG: hypothetical protein ACNS62_02585 [Candidatus Cyclobacteriaceae bacterium M3_2C_046]
MKYINLLLISLTFLVCFSCSSGKSAYKRGDYFSAVMQSVDRLRRNDSHKKSRETLRKAYPMAVRYYNSKIENIKNSNEQFKNGIIYDAYQDLNTIHESIIRCPGALRVIARPQNFNREARQYQQKAADERYQAGELALNRKNRLDAIDAYNHFMFANDYLPGYKDIEDKIDEARYYATLKVLVDQVPVPTVNFQLSVEFFQEQVEEFLSNYAENQFVEFYTPRDRNHPDPDQVLQIRFDDFVVGQTTNYRDSREISKDSVVVGQVTLDNGKKKDVIGSAKATFTENRQEIVSSGLITMRIVDAQTRKVLVHEKFPGEFVWVSRWASYKGDERALDKEQIELSKSRPSSPPSHQNMFIEFCRPIYTQLQSRVRSYYRNI